MSATGDTVIQNGSYTYGEYVRMVEQIVTLEAQVVDLLEQIDELTP